LGQETGENNPGPAGGKERLPRGGGAESSPSGDTKGVGVSLWIMPLLKGERKDRGTNVCEGGPSALRSGLSAKNRRGRKCNREDSLKPRNGGGRHLPNRAAGEAMNRFVASSASVRIQKIDPAFKKETRKGSENAIDDFSAGSRQSKKNSQESRHCGESVRTGEQASEECRETGRHGRG